MSDEVLDNLIKNAIEYADEYLTFAFHGGEPTLAGIDFFKKVVSLQKQYATLKPSLRIDDTIQTNGVALNDEWCEFFHKENFLVGVSLNGPRKNHDLARIMADGKESFTKVMQGIELLKKYNVDFNILTVVTEQLSKKASALYRFYKRNGFNYVQLIPCMDEEERQSGLSRDENKDVTYAIKPESYGRFLNEFFDMWYEDFKCGDIMDVRMFYNLAQMTVGYPPEECGMCGKCEYYDLCRGGCRRFRETGINKDGVNYLCEGYKLFFGHNKERFIKLGQTIINPAARRNL